MEKKSHSSKTNQIIQAKMLKILFNKHLGGRENKFFFTSSNIGSNSFEFLCTDYQIYFSKKMKGFRKIVEKKFKDFKFWVVYCKTPPAGYK